MGAPTGDAAKGHLEFHSRVEARRSFEGIAPQTVEAHVLDETLDLYGKRVDLAFIEYIRPMNRFDGMDALVAQMNADEVRIRTVLGYPQKS